MVRAEEKLHGVISSLQDQVNNWDHRGIKKITLENMINDLEVVDAEFHDANLPPITDDIQLDNKVCLFYLTNKLADIIAEKDDDQKLNQLTLFYNDLIFNLGINALHNHKNVWENR
jgi:monomeric isocitrate dehydrogenase